MNQLIQNAHVIHGDERFDADIRIENGKISALEKPGTLEPEPGERVFNVVGKYVLPGFIDPHVHLSLPTPAGLSADDFKTGSRTARAGGVIHMIDFVTPQRGQSLIEALKQRKDEAKECRTDLDFHMGISGWLPDMERQMEGCVKEHGIRSFKTYLAYRQNMGIGYQELEKVMQVAARLDSLVLVHAEEDEPIEALRKEFVEKGYTHPRYHALSRPPETESQAVKKVIELVRKTQCKTYFVHISSAESARLIAGGKKEGLPLFAETCPQYLLFDDQVYEGTFEQSAPYVFSPPARPSYHREELWKHLASGTFDTVATDHCPFTMQQKREGQDDFTRIPNGAGSLEFRARLLYSFGVLPQKITLGKWVDLLSGSAAEIFGLGNKGRICVGNDARLVVFDPNVQEVLSVENQVQNCDINIYSGLKTYGKGSLVSDL